MKTPVMGILKCKTLFFLLILALFASVWIMWSGERCGWRYMLDQNTEFFETFKRGG